MIRRILLATDFSTRSDRAQRRATMIATKLGASLSLAHVVDDDQPPHLIDAQIAASRAVLEEAARTIGQFDGITADARIVTGDPFAGILNAAEDVAADLIVLGPHRRQMRDVFVGTTADRTIAHSPRPLLIAAGVPSACYDRALIALDIDDQSISTARRARGTGILHGAEVIAMHAFAAPARGMMQRAMSEPEAIDRYLAGEEQRVSEQFDALLAGSGLDPDRRELRPVEGSAARTILECAHEEDAALIVIGASRRTGIERFMLGNVSEDILADSDRDVLVLPK